MTMFWVKISPLKQLLMSIDFLVERSAWGRLASAAPKQKRTTSMDDGSVHRPLRGSAQIKGSQEEQMSTLKACEPVVHCGGMLFGRVVLK